jgi:hypothetical protein
MEILSPDISSPDISSTDISSTSNKIGDFVHQYYTTAILSQCYFVPSNDFVHCQMIFLHFSTAIVFQLLCHRYFRSNVIEFEE